MILPLNLFFQLVLPSLQLPYLVSNDPHALIGFGLLELHLQLAHHLIKIRIHKGVPLFWVWEPSNPSRGVRPIHGKMRVSNPLRGLFRLWDSHSGRSLMRGLAKRVQLLKVADLLVETRAFGNQAWAIILGLLQSYLVFLTPGAVCSWVDGFLDLKQDFVGLFPVVSLVAPIINWHCEVFITAGLWNFDIRCVYYRDLTTILNKAFDFVLDFFLSI